jgi:hypothetical protein
MLVWLLHETRSVFVATRAASKILPCQIISQLQKGESLSKHPAGEVRARDGEMERRRERERRQQGGERLKDVS